MVKNKTLPDSARLCQNLQTPLSGHSLSLSLSFCLSPSKTWTYQGWSHVFSLCLSLTPFMLRVPPGSCWGWTLAIIGKALLACLALIKLCLSCKTEKCSRYYWTPLRDEESDSENTEWIATYSRSDLTLCLLISGAFQLAQWVKNLPAMQEMQETQVWSLS